MRYFSLSRKWKQTVTEAVFLSCSVIAGMGALGKLYRVQTQTRTTTTNAKSPVCYNSSNRNRFISSFDFLNHFPYLRGKLNWHHWNGSWIGFAGQPWFPLMAVGLRKDVLMQIFVPWSFKKTGVKWAFGVRIYIGISNKLLAETDKRHLVHSIQAMQHKIE